MTPSPGGATVTPALATRPAATTDVVAAIGRLPALPVVVSRLVEISAAPDATAADLSEVIELDTALLTAILKLANSAYYGQSRTVSDIEAAVMLLGFDQVRDLALSLDLIAAVEPDGPVSFSTRDYWKHAFMVGSLARTLCRRLYGVIPGEHYVSGFLHDIGRLVLHLVDPQGMREVVAAVTAGEAAGAVERRVFGCDHAEVGALACRRWHLPERVAAATACHHGDGLDADPTLAERDLNQIVHVADLFANRAGLGFISARRSRHKLASPFREAIGRRGIRLRRAILAETVHRLAVEVEATAQILALGQPQAEQG
jgi:putative nucleotidyltransferase with HDIG domain